jgi:hypothetical protein
MTAGLLYPVRRVMPHVACRMFACRMAHQVQKPRLRHSAWLIHIGELCDCCSRLTVRHRRLRISTTSTSRPQPCSRSISTRKSEIPPVTKRDFTLRSLWPNPTPRNEPLHSRRSALCWSTRSTRSCCSLCCERGRRMRACGCTVASTAPRGAMRSWVCTLPPLFA